MTAHTGNAHAEWMDVYRWLCGVWTDGWIDGCAYGLDDVWALSVCVSVYACLPGGRRQERSLGKYLFMCS